VNAAIAISSDDNVATALEALEPGRVLDVAGRQITVGAAIPRGHKIALRSIRAGEPVIKYGSPIGTATADIAAGMHVHTHNVESTRGRGDRGAAHESPPSPKLP
jgi:altronate dehydratase